MKRLFNYYLPLFFLVFTTSTCIAQSASTASNKNKSTASTAKTSDNAGQTVMDLMVDTTNANNDAPGTAFFQVDPNPSKGMINVRTECAGRVYFYSQKGKEKGACMVNEGLNMIYLENVLNPGEYLCRFEGINGTSAKLKVVYKP